ncbi:MAG: methyltransferase domain-containing protein [Gammaproteobacteria bacterium]|nr:methyltransferase domain-containing protein [Gammaproteobacteria bacterium]
MTSSVPDNDPCMTRNEKALKHINKDGIGLEIGPSHNPIAPKRSGYKVHILDHADRKQLIDKYKSHSVNIDNIEDVDFVCRGESYADITGNSRQYDWIIASHVIEHMPDLIGFILDCDSILKNDGVISLVVPDKRYCFDHFRPISGISKIIDAHIQKCTTHTAGNIAEYMLNVTAKGGQIGWDKNFVGGYKLMHSLQDALNEMNSALMGGKYLDIHAWCFVPSSFRLIINDLYDLKLIPFREVGFYPTNGHEFYVAIGRNGDGIHETRLDMLKYIEHEIAVGNGPEADL